MKKLSMTLILALIGILSWGITLPLRESLTINNNIITFILGIMPNIGAAWFFLGAAEVVAIRDKKDFTFKTASILSALILLFAVISEIIHDLFINSPFDIYDIIATICSLTLYLIIFYATKKSEKQ